MKKVFLSICVGIAVCSTLLGGPYCRGNSGVNLAADIIGLVGMGLNVLRPPVVVASPGVVAPVAPVAPVGYGPPAYAVPQVIPPVPAYGGAPIVVAPVTNVYPAGYVAPAAPVVYPTAPVVYPGYGYPGFGPGPYGPCFRR